MLLGIGLISLVILLLINTNDSIDECNKLHELVEYQLNDFFFSWVKQYRQLQSNVIDNVIGHRGRLSSKYHNFQRGMDPCRFVSGKWSVNVFSLLIDETKSSEYSQILPCGWTLFSQEKW